MTDVMLDLETLGNGKNACIVQIGACYFNRKTGEIGDTFSCNVDARTSVKTGAEIDADTVYWWLSQSKEAIDSFTKAPLEDLISCMHSLNDFLSKADAIWSHATFDFVIISETYKRLGIKPKFKYKAARDIRTLTDLAQNNDRPAREGVHHNALDDCKFQVKYCVIALNKLKGLNEKS